MNRFDRKQEALELMKEYPEQTKGLSWQEVAMRWEEYSDTMAAGWMLPDTESVNRVFAIDE